MRAKRTCDWLIQSVCGFTIAKLEKLSFKKFIPKFSDGKFQDFFFGKFQKMIIGIGL